MSAFISARRGGLHALTHASLKGGERDYVLPGARRACRACDEKPHAAVPHGAARHISHAAIHMQKSWFESRRER
jgi:hypothetical protein